jgi:hypothetical protein
VNAVRRSLQTLRKVRTARPVMQHPCKHCDKSFPARTIRHHQARCWRNLHRYQRVLAELAAKRETLTRQFVEAHAPGETDVAIHRLLTAVHESAHAVPCHVGGQLYDRIMIYEEPNRDADGALTTYPGQRLSSPQDHETTIVSSLAAAEAEVECRRTLTDPGYYCSAEDLWCSSCRGDFLCVLNLTTAMGITPEHTDSYCYAAQERAHALVCEHWSDILAVAENLLQVGELTYDEVGDILTYEEAIRGVDLNSL